MIYLPKTHMASKSQGWSPSLGYSALSNPELSSLMGFFLFVSSEKKCCEYVCVFSLFIVQLNIFFFKIQRRGVWGYWILYAE